MKKCYDCAHVEMCGWRKEVKEHGCEFFGDGIAWIPVSERLPSESGWYFVTVQGVECVSDMVWYYHESHEWNGVSETQKVLAWMPLPEPYKGGEEE